MEDCCVIEPSRVATTAGLLCPQNGLKGRKVKPLTVRSLIAETRKGEVQDDVLYGYCAAPECDVVYFDEAGWTVRKQDLKIRVGVKETEDPIPVCYCFGYTRADIHNGIRETGTTTIPPKIRAEVKAGRCACETKNPSGSCCLGDVERAVKEVRAELGREDDAATALSTATAAEVSSPRVSPVGASSGDRSGLLLGGALASGFLASACCLGPVLFAVLGIGGAGFLLKFEPYRPLFTVLTLALLAAGFYFAYRKPKAVGATGAPDLDGCGCEMPRANRTGRVLLWVAATVIGFFLAFPYIAQAIWG